MAVTNNIAPVIAAVGDEELNFPTESRRTFELLRRERDGSKYHGVEWAKYTRKWKAHILNLNARNGHSTFLGYFEDEIEAARAYDRAMLSMPREKAVAKKNNYRGDGTLAVPSQSPLSISKKTIGAVAAAHAGSNHSRTSNVTTIKTCTVDEQLNFPSERASNTVKWGGKSQYRGVCWIPRDNKWLAQIHRLKRAGRPANESPRQIGLFTSEEDAARAYDKAALELHGAEAHLNFPQPEHQRQLQAAARERGHFAGRTVSQSGKATQSVFRGVQRKVGLPGSCQWTAHITIPKEKLVPYHKHAAQKKVYRVPVTRRADGAGYEFEQERVAGQQVFLGSFSDEVAAARAFDVAARVILGGNAILNFPLDDSQSDSQRGQCNMAAAAKTVSNDTKVDGIPDDVLSTSAEQHTVDKAQCSTTAGSSKRRSTTRGTHDDSAAEPEPDAEETARAAGAVVEDHGGRGTSNFRGVSWDMKSKCWIVQIHLGSHKAGKQKLKRGGFTDEEEAARAYDMFAIQHHKHKCAPFPFFKHSSLVLVLCCSSVLPPIVREAMLDGKRRSLSMCCLNVVQGSSQLPPA